MGNLNLRPAVTDKTKGGRGQETDLDLCKDITSEADKAYGRLNRALGGTKLPGDTLQQETQ